MEAQASPARRCIARWLPPAFQKGIDIDAVDSAVDMPYDIPEPARRIRARASRPAMPTGFWRGVGPNNNVFAIESFIDELARKAGKDPVAVPARHAGQDAARCRAALDLVAEKSGWGDAAAAARRAAASAMQPSFAQLHRYRRRSRGRRAGRGTRCAASPRAVDTGIAVNPDTIVAQLQGGLIFGLTAALYGEITIEKGRVQQTQLPRLPHAAHQRDAADRGAPSSRAARRPAASARPATTAAPPALRNAIYAATGVALRRLPIDRDAAGRGKERHERLSRIARWRSW